MVAQEKNGWIKLHRKLLDNPIIMKDADHLAVWMYLLLNATHAEYPALFKGQKIMLAPGQLITGRKSIADKLAINESKVTRILDAFKSEHQIEQQTSNKNRLISILNWDFYQSSEQQDELQMNNNRTTSEQQVNTNKNIKNIKNEKNVINNMPDSDEPEPAPVKKSKSDKPVKHKYGEYSHVLLTDNEYSNLANSFGIELRDKAIKFLDEYIEDKGYKSKSHNMAIRRWVIDAVKEKEKKQGRKEMVPDWMNKQNKFNNFPQRDYDFAELEARLLAKDDKPIPDPAVMARAEELKKRLT